LGPDSGKPGGPRADISRSAPQTACGSAGGLGNKEIAADLRITTHTVKYHLAAVLEKLGVRSRTEAVSLGVRTGLVAL
jgi:DNA-binding NarL/FixJ family response regulator